MTCKPNEAVIGALVATLLAAGSPAQSESTTFRDRAARRAAFEEREIHESIRAGLAWLRLHQDEDGRWDSDGFAKHDGAEPTDGAGRAIHDVGLTGLALLALLAEDDPAYRESVARAADWLVGQQQRSSGRFPVASHDFIYDQAIATLALIEAHALTGNERWRNSAVAGLGYLARHRNPGAAWRYQPRDGDNDSSVTSWCLMAAMSAVHAGLEVTPESVAEPLGWLASITDPATGHCGYTRMGEPSARLSAEHWERFPETGHALTSAALHARLLAGGAPEDAVNRAAAELILTIPPRWSADGTLDMYYWFHASQAMSHMDPEHREKWQEPLRSVLLAAQRKDGNFTGSWDPLGPWGEAGGRIYSTALAVLSLQAPYRHGSVRAEDQIPESAAFRRVRGAWRRGRIGEAAAAVEKLADEELDEKDREGLRRIRWYLEVDQILAAKILELLANTEDPDWPALMLRLEHLEESFHGTPTGDRAAAEIARLRKDPKVSRELEANEKLLAMRERFDPRRPRHRAALIRQLGAFVSKYEGTAAARKARKWLSELRR